MRACWRPATRALTVLSATAAPSTRDEIRCLNTKELLAGAAQIAPNGAIDQAGRQLRSPRQPVIAAPAAPPFAFGSQRGGAAESRPRPRRSNSVSGAPSQPKLVQWAKEALQYYEGSTLVLSCSLAISQPPAAPALKFAWFKQGKPLGSGAAVAGGQQGAAHNQPLGRLSIETLADYSFLRLADLRSADSGPYTCVASNSFGQEDRTSTQVIVNVKLRWAAVAPPGEEQANATSLIGAGLHELRTVRAGQAAVFECAAAAQPQPRIRWFKLVRAPPGGRHRSQQQQQQQLNADGALRAAPFHHQSGGWLSAAGQQRLDEAQLRAGLLQLDSAAANSAGELASASAFSFQRIEIPLSAASNKAAEVVLAANETMRWRVESSVGLAQHEIRSRLILDKADAGSQAIYECEASALEQQQQQQQSSTSSAQSHASGDLAKQQQLTGDKLRRFFGLLVNGASTNEKQAVREQRLTS